MMMHGRMNHNAHRTGIAATLCCALLGAISVLAGTGTMQAQDTKQSAAAATDMWHQPTMLNWGPAREKLAEHGLSYNFHYYAVALGNPNAPQGTDEHFGNWERIRGTVDADFGKFSAWHGLYFHATAVWQNGVDMGSVIGSIASPSGLISSHQFRLDSMTLTQNFVKDKVQLTAGIMASQDLYGLDYYIGYFVAEPLFYNFGNMGNVRASYDPESAPAVNLKIVPSKSYFVQSGYFLPSDDGEQHKYPTGFNYKSGNHGATFNIAAGYNTDANAPKTRKSYPGVYQAGFIVNGSKAGSVSATTGASGFFDYNQSKYVDGNHLFYLQANQPVYRVQAGSDRGLDAAFGVSTSPADKAKIPTQYTAGLIFHAPIAQRAKDSVALGLVASPIGDAFNRYTVAHGGTALKNETLIELNYRAQLTPWLSIQPVYQHYANVGGSKHDANLAGFQFLSVF